MGPDWTPRSGRYYSSDDRAPVDRSASNTARAVGLRDSAARVVSSARGASGAKSLLQTGAGRHMRGKACLASKCHKWWRRCRLMVRVYRVYFRTTLCIVDTWTPKTQCNFRWQENSRCRATSPSLKRWRFSHI